MLNIDSKWFLPVSNIKFWPAFAGKYDRKVKSTNTAMVGTLISLHYTCERIRK
jgi:hypothetical protein